jgi:hypothetical protein
MSIVESATMIILMELTFSLFCPVVNLHMTKLSS